MDVVTSLSTAVALAKRLREISRNIEAAEFKNVLADLISELADAKLEAASLKENTLVLQNNIRDLKQEIEAMQIAEANPPTGLDGGLYVWEGEEGMFCTACWDSKKSKSRVTHINMAGLSHMCPVCKATFGR